jgi:hypothetical protein
MKKPKEIIIKKNNKIDLPKIINSEVNLLVFPFFALERKNKKVETVYKDIVKRGDQKIEIVWNVSANTKYGYPGLFDRGVHKSIEQIITEILKKDNIIKNPIRFSVYDLCKRMGISTSGGKNYRKVKEALERIRMTGIKSEGAFYHKGKKQWISSVFGLYDGIIFKGKQLEDGTIAETNLLYLSGIYLQSLNSFYVKPTDYDYLQSLKSKIASRLYEILGVKFYGLRDKRENFICYRYSKLCQLLPVTPHEYISLAKQQLDPGNNELKETDFISKYEWSENGKEDWLIYYWPGERAKEEMRRAKTKIIGGQIEEYLSEAKEEVKLISKGRADLVNKLVKLNVSKVTADDLIKNNDQEVIEKWIEAIHYAKAEDKAAYLVKAIRENWLVPEEYLREIKEKQGREEEEKIEFNKIKQKEEENKKRQEETKKIEQIYNSINPLQQEEIRIEIENRLPDFWKVQLNKERINLSACEHAQTEGKTSKMLEAAIEEKRREIIKEWIDSGRVKA